MEDVFFDDGNDVSSLQEMDRGTLNTQAQKAFKASLTKSSTKYTEYFRRVGPGLSNLTIEIKKHLDETVMPDLSGVLAKITDGRFTKAYCDVRIYPQSRPFDKWESTEEWSGEVLDIVVAFVLSIPDDDSLDSMTRMTLLGLFEEDSWDPTVKKISQKLKLNNKLNVDAMVGVINDCIFDDFNPSDFGGMTLEILFDGCSQNDYEKLSAKACGPEIQAKRKLQENDPTVALKEVSIKNVASQVPVLISLLANELGVKHINPKKLKTSDNLYSLMGFDSTATKSLVASLMAHFGVLHIVGASRMVTVGNAIEFAQEVLESRQDY